MNEAVRDLAETTAHSLSDLVDQAHDRLSKVTNMRRSAPWYAPLVRPGALVVVLAVAVGVYLVIRRQRNDMPTA